MTVEDQEVAKICKTEVRRALKRMKSGKAVGPNDIQGLDNKLKHLSF